MFNYPDDDHLLVEQAVYNGTVIADRQYPEINYATESLVMFFLLPLTYIVFSGVYWEGYVLNKETDIICCQSTEPKLWFKIVSGFIMSLSVLITFMSLFKEKANWELAEPGWRYDNLSGSYSRCLGWIMAMLIYRVV